MIDNVINAYKFFFTWNITRSINKLIILCITTSYDRSHIYNNKIINNDIVFKHNWKIKTDCQNNNRKY